MKGGRSTFLGINSQATAALALFLQYVKYQDFQKIVFEGKDLEDFALYFANGKKMICESKDYQRGISHSTIREIIDKIVYHNQLQKKDEILIIASKISEDVKKEFKDIKLWLDFDKKRYENLGYSEDALGIITQVKLWEINPSDTEKVISALFSQMLGIWIPQDELIKRINDLLVDKVYKGSAKGQEYTRSEFFSEIIKQREDIIKNSGLFDDERIKLENQLRNIITALDDNKKPEWAVYPLSSLTAQPNKMIFVLDKFKNRTDINLSDWDDLWRASTASFYSSYLIDIFKKNVQSDSNKNYMLEFINDYLIDNLPQYRSEFAKVDIANLAEEILKSDPNQARKVFQICEKLLAIDLDDLMYIKTSNGENWEMEEIFKVIRLSYNNGDANLKKEIVNYILNHFNLVKDEHKTPFEVFNILKAYSIKDLERVIKEYTPLIVKQYEKFYKKFGEKVEYKGWDLMGGMVSQMGNVYTASDHKFIESLLKPALNEYYRVNNDKAWEFITNYCITTNPKNVSKTKPDFLNRASISVVISEYVTGKHKRQAYRILSSFIKMKKIPLKADYIFQELKNNLNVTDKDKWALIKVSLKTYDNLPVNAFVEQITSELAAKGFNEAIFAISEWIKNPEYTKSQIISSNLVSNISVLLESNKTFNKGLTILESYLFSESFVNRTNNFNTYDVAKLVTKILSTKPSLGIKLIQKINQSDTLTINQQILISSSISDLPKENKKLLLSIFRRFIKPFLLELTTKNIEQRFFYRHSREMFVQFAEKLAQSYCFAESLWIIKRFINDSDPPKDGSNYEDDPKGDFNYHDRLISGEETITINTVRGYVAWALQKFAILQGRKYIPKIIPLIKTLSIDPNYYVRQQACIPLIDLVRNRHTVIPTNANERFLSLKTASNIEEIAFNMLFDKDNQKVPGLMKSIGMVFGYIRNLNDKDAYRVMDIFLNSDFQIKNKEKERSDLRRKSKLDEDKVIADIIPLFIYYTEFRKDAFKKTDFIPVFGKKEWDLLNSYRGDKVKELFLLSLKNSSLDINYHIAWNFWKLVHNVDNEYERLFRISYSYLKILAEYNYDHRTYETIYRFIEDNIDKKFDECFNLWTICLAKEKDYFDKNFDPNDLHEAIWRPYHYNDKILLKVLKYRGVDEFLYWLNHLLNYPVQVYIAYNLDQIVEELKRLPKDDNRVKENFELIIKRNASYFDVMQKWMEA